MGGILTISMLILNDVDRTAVFSSNAVHRWWYHDIRVSTCTRLVITSKERRRRYDVVIHLFFYHFLLLASTRHVVHDAGDRDKEQKEHEYHVEHDEKV